MGVPFNEQQEVLHPDDLGSSSEQGSEQHSDGRTESTSEDEENNDAVEEEQGYAFSTEESEDWNDPSDGGVLTHILRATEYGDEEILEQLIPQLSVPIDTPGNDHDTALHLAALYGHFACARLLLEAGSRADVRDEDDALPLHDAAAGGYADLVELLLEYAPECIDATDNDGDTPLHNAARGGAADVIRLLLDKGADPLIQNNDMLRPTALASANSEPRELLMHAELERAGMVASPDSEQ